MDIIFLTDLHEVAKLPQVNKYLVFFFIGPCVD